MSKATQADTRKRKYQANTSALERLLESYGAGREFDEHGTAINADRVQSEIVGKYRAIGQCLQDKNDGVSYDGPLGADIQAALWAAEARGFLRGQAEGKKL